MEPSEVQKRPVAPPTFTDWVRRQVAWVLAPIGAFLNHLGIHPNVITITGLAGNIFGAYLLSQGEFFWGGVAILFMVLIDALDGATARARGESSQWGAFVDSTTDRFTEAITFLGLLFYYSANSETIENATLYMVLVYLTFVGSVMVSYTRARAESLGFKASVGLLSRLERYIILLFSLIVLRRPEFALWVIAVLGNLTALHRIFHVRKQYYAEHTPDEV